MQKCSKLKHDLSNVHWKQHEHAHTILADLQLKAALENKTKNKTKKTNPQLSHIINIQFYNHSTEMLSNEEDKEEKR